MPPAIAGSLAYTVGQRENGGTGRRALENVVLVHGGFVDGRKGGYQVSVVQNPTTSLQDDVAATQAKRAGATIVEVKGSHAIYVSQPGVVAALIERAAKGGS